MLGNRNIVVTEIFHARYCYCILKGEGEGDENCNTAYDMKPSASVPLHSLQGGWGGWPTGNGKDLAAARLSWARQHAWLLLILFPFPVGHPPHPPCSLQASVSQSKVHLTATHPNPKAILPSGAMGAVDLPDAAGPGRVDDWIGMQSVVELVQRWRRSPKN